MRLAESVRIGGKLALAIGFVCSNLVFSSSLSYFSGYQGSSFGASTTSDPFSSQNVPLTPAVSMVSTPAVLLGSTATSSSTAGLSTSYGFSTPAAQGSSSTSTAVSSTSSATMFSVMSGSSVTPQATSFSASASGTPAQTTSTLGATGLFLYSAPAGSPNTSMTIPATQVASSGFLFGQTFTGPVAVKSNVNVSAASLRLDPSGNPEPSTWVSMSVGLAFVLFKLRRRET